MLAIVRGKSFFFRKTFAYIRNTVNRCCNRNVSCFDFNLVWTEQISQDKTHSKSYQSTQNNNGNATVTTSHWEQERQHRHYLHLKSYTYLYSYIHTYICIFLEYTSKMTGTKWYCHYDLVLLKGIFVYRLYGYCNTHTHIHTYVSSIYRCINSRIPYLHMESLSSEGKGTKFIIILGLEGKTVSTRLFLITVCLCVCVHILIAKLE